MEVTNYVQWDLIFVIDMPVKKKFKLRTSNKVKIFMRDDGGDRLWGIDTKLLYCRRFRSPISQRNFTFTTVTFTSKNRLSPWSLISQWLKSVGFWTRRERCAVLTCVTVRCVRLPPKVKILRRSTTLPPLKNYKKTKNVKGRST